MTTAKELRDTALAQEAWGKWNTAPAWNRYYAAKEDRRAGWIGRMVDLAVLAAGWGLAALHVALVARMLGV